MVTLGPGAPVIIRNGKKPPEKGTVFSVDVGKKLYGYDVVIDGMIKYRVAEKVSPDPDFPPIRPWNFLPEE
jgi:hypothetical protein